MGNHRRTAHPAQDPVIVSPGDAGDLCVVITVVCAQGHPQGQWIDYVTAGDYGDCDACGYDPDDGPQFFQISTRIAIRATPYLVQQATDQGLLWTPPTEENHDLSA